MTVRIDDPADPPVVNAIAAAAPSTHYSGSMLAIVMVVDGGVTTLRRTPVPDLQPQPFTVAGWAVADIDAEVDALVSTGVRLNSYDGMEQDERGIWTTPGGDRVAWFCDPFSNTLSLTQFGTT